MWIFLHIMALSNMISSSLSWWYGKFVPRMRKFCLKYEKFALNVKKSALYFENNLFSYFEPYFQIWCEYLESWNIFQIKLILMAFFQSLKRFRGQQSEAWDCHELIIWPDLCPFYLKLFPSFQIFASYLKIWLKIWKKVVFEIEGTIFHI